MLSISGRLLAKLSPELIVLGAKAISETKVFGKGYVSLVSRFGALTTKGKRASYAISNSIKTINPYNLKITHARTMTNRAFKKFVDNDIKPNGIQESIKYVEHEGKRYVVDGHHRLEAAKYLGFEEIPIEKVELPYNGYKTVEDLYYYGPSF